MTARRTSVSLKEVMDEEFALKLQEEENTQRQTEVEPEIPEWQTIQRDLQTTEEDHFLALQLQEAEYVVEQLRINKQYSSNNINNNNRIRNYPNIKVSVESRNNNWSYYDDYERISDKHGSDDFYSKKGILFNELLPRHKTNPPKQLPPPIKKQLLPNPSDSIPNFCGFDQVSTELVLWLFSMLDGINLGKCLMVSKQFYEWASIDLLWRKQMERCYLFEHTHYLSRLWKTSYAAYMKFQRNLKRKRPKTLRLIDPEIHNKNHRSKGLPFPSIACADMCGSYIATGHSDMSIRIWNTSYSGWVHKIADSRKVEEGRGRVCVKLVRMIEYESMERGEMMDKTGGIGNGVFLFFGNGEAEWVLVGLEEKHELSRTSWSTFSRFVYCLDANDSHVAVGTGDTQILVYDRKSGSKVPHVLVGHEHSIITHVQIEENQLISSSRSGEIRIWNLENFSCSSNFTIALTSTLELQNFFWDKTRAQLITPCLQIWNIKKKNLVDKFKKKFRYARVMVLGEFLIACSRFLVDVFRISDKQQIGTIDLCFCFCVGNGKLVGSKRRGSGGNDGNVTVLDFL